jgi:hypothetical protein
MMIYKMHSQTEEHTFAALVGTNDKDEMVFKAAWSNVLNRTHPAEQEIATAIQKEDAQPNWQVMASLGYTSVEVNKIFDEWKKDHVYGYVKDQVQLHDEAGTVEELAVRKQNGRTYEGTELIRAISVRPLLVVNLNKYPNGFMQFVEPLAERIQQNYQNGKA